MADEEYETISFSSVEEAWDWLDCHIKAPASNLKLYRGMGVRYMCWCPKTDE